MVLLTRGLLTVLLERASAEDPEPVNVLLDTTPAGELGGDTGGADPETPVLTHFYLPEAGGSVRAVFGMDLGTPTGRARFVSHTDGDPALTEADDLAGAVLVAVPPYEEGDVYAYDRRGRGVDLAIVDAEPPEERLGEP
ncbi:MPN domain-containing protein [Halorarum salinum]|uniref:Uncharacterized protein n=1 Tax=Halorarum salinum TaxID=2743089 RepID=A0A7D5QME1_9EURY|nr:hypothetical protein [Halobaculum salinum]QLG63425.1 hypothetical protein HUG12_17480 [Halobaculum salinum]